MHPYFGPPRPNFWPPAGGRTPHDGRRGPDWPRYCSEHCWGSLGVQRSHPRHGPHCGTSRGPFRGCPFWPPPPRTPLRPPTGGSSVWRVRCPQPQGVWEKREREGERKMCMDFGGRNLVVNNIVQLTQCKSLSWLECSDGGRTTNFWASNFNQNVH